MTNFLSAVADASLPVAAGLLILAAAARGVKWLVPDDPRMERLAQQYLEPLSTWCLIALAVHTFALVAAGRTGVIGVALPIVLGVAAVLLREDSVEDELVSEERPATTSPAAPAPMPAAEPVAGLWARSAEHVALRSS